MDTDRRPGVTLRVYHEIRAGVGIGSHGKGGLRWEGLSSLGKVVYGGLWGRWLVGNIQRIPSIEARAPGQLKSHTAIQRCHLYIESRKATMP